MHDGGDFAIASFNRVLKLVHHVQRVRKLIGIGEGWHLVQGGASGRQDITCSRGPLQNARHIFDYSKNALCLAACHG